MDGKDGEPAAERLHGPLQLAGKNFNRYSQHTVPLLGNSTDGTSKEILVSVQSQFSYAYTVNIKPSAITLRVTECDQLAKSL